MLLKAENYISAFNMPSFMKLYHLFYDLKLKSLFTREGGRAFVINKITI